MKPKILWLQWGINHKYESSKISQISIKYDTIEQTVLALVDDEWLPAPFSEELGYVNCID